MEKIQAIQIVAKYGLHHAKKILKDTETIANHGWYFYWCNECGHGGSSEHMISVTFTDSIACPKCYSENLNTDDGIELDLRNVIEAFNVIKSLEGLKNAKFLINTFPDLPYLRGFSIENITKCIHIVDEVEKLNASK